MKMTMQLLLTAVAVAVAVVQGQQGYVATKQLDCYNDYRVYTTIKGYLCSGNSTLCVSYLTFRSIDPCNSPTSIAYLLNSTPEQIAAANNISEVDPIPTDTPVLVPVNCSCSGDYSQHNASYTIKTAADTYFSVANNTYQGLTTCQALMHQNPYDSRNLTVGLGIEVPVRCACPTVSQAAAGINNLVVYLVDWGDDIDLIAQRFGVDKPTLLVANDMSSDSTLSLLHDTGSSHNQTIPSSTAAANLAFSIATASFILLFSCVKSAYLPPFVKHKHGILFPTYEMIGFDKLS